MKSKYDPLCYYLLSVDTDTVTLTFSEIETIIGGELPPSALTYREWWANDVTHSQAMSGWLAADWHSALIDVPGKTVTFRRMARPRR